MSHKLMHCIRMVVLRLTGAPAPRASQADGGGFTLVELLVVVAVMGILAVLVFPALARAKEYARKAACLSNTRQIGIAVHCYMADNASRYPTVDRADWRSFRLGGGDPDPTAAARFGMEWATNRLLWPYSHSRELYRCPADRGMNDMPWMEPFNSNYQTLGSSYKYNERPWLDLTLVPDKDPYSGIAGKNENWISQPNHYVLFNEPPATPFWDGGWFYFFWHHARGPNTVFSLSQVRDRLISSALFADGHAREYDFTGAITRRPDFPCEPTPDWYFYEPARGVP